MGKWRFLSQFLSGLGEKKKAMGPIKNFSSVFFSFLFSLSTKQEKSLFSLPFSLSHFLSPLFSLHPNKVFSPNFLARGTPPQWGSMPQFLTGALKSTPLYILLYFASTPRWIFTVYLYNICFHCNVCS